MTSRTKTRADQLLVDRGHAESRAKAQALILARLVFSGERKIEKAGQALAADAPLEVRGRVHPWVSRGYFDRKRVFLFFQIRWIVLDSDLLGV